MKLKIIKRDGNSESYIYTKILRTLCGCLEQQQEGISTAEQIADAFTFYLYSRDDNVVTTSEIHTMLKIVLSEAGFEKAAEKLHEHHYLRAMKRNRIKVIAAKVEDINDAKIFCEIKQFGLHQRWEKYTLIQWLQQKCKLDNIEARAVASTVEEKILNTDISAVTTHFIKELALIEVASLQQAQQCHCQKKTRKVIPDFTIEQNRYSIAATV